MAVLVFVMAGNAEAKDSGSSVRLGKTRLTGQVKQIVPEKHRVTLSVLQEQAEEASGTAEEGSFMMLVLTIDPEEGILFDDQGEKAVFEEIERDMYLTVVLDRNGKPEQIILKKELKEETPESPEEGTAKEGEEVPGEEAPGQEEGTPGEEVPGQEEGAPGEEPGLLTAPEYYPAVLPVSYTLTAEDMVLKSADADENALLTDGSSWVTVHGASIGRYNEASTGGDAADVYGLGAAVLAKDDSLFYMDHAQIETDAAGAAGVFIYGNAYAMINDVNITTLNSCSGAVRVSGGGTLSAENVTAVTQGESSAAVSSGRGKGTLEVLGGSYQTYGPGSPAVYCTADIKASDAVLQAFGSEAVCVEGGGALSLTDCDVSGFLPSDEENSCSWNVLLYRSMSAEEMPGTASFSMTGGRLAANAGGMFYTTNTQSTITLEHTELVYSPEDPYLLKVTGNRDEWGTAGANGAVCALSAKNQIMSGNIITDSISVLSVDLTEGSSFTGTFVPDESAVDVPGAGYIDVSIDAASGWTVTDSCTVRNLVCAGVLTDPEGKRVRITDAAGNVYAEGESEITVTVSWCMITEPVPETAEEVPAA